MTRLFDHPFLLGFEEIEKALEQMGHLSQDGYPPYNIEQTGDDSLSITLAVAGFRRGELSIFVERNRLVVRGKRNDTAAANGDSRFLHRGIAMRQFERSFLLAEGLRVVDAELSEGLLAVNLERPPLKERIQHIEVREVTPPIDQPSIGRSGKAAAKLDKPDKEATNE